MRRGEKAKLERQGAKAAARGESLRSNPLLTEPNMPASTGESLQEWASRHDAWQDGYEVQRRAHRKRTARSR
jgi:hypothetical protein